MELAVRGKALVPGYTVGGGNLLREVRKQAYATHLRDCERCRIAMSRSAMCSTGRELT